MLNAWLAFQVPTSTSHTCRVYQSFGAQHCQYRPCPNFHKHHSLAQGMRVTHQALCTNDGFLVGHFYCMATTMVTLDRTSRLAVALWKVLRVPTGSYTIIIQCPKMLRTISNRCSRIKWRPSQCLASSQRRFFIVKTSPLKSPNSNV